MFNRKTVNKIFDEAGLEVPKDVLQQLFDEHLDSMKTRPEPEAKPEVKAEAQAVPEKSADVVALEKKIAEMERTQKTEQYRKTLKNVGIAPNCVDLILKGTNLDEVDAGDAEAAKTAYAEFIVKTKTVGTEVPTPPQAATAEPKPKDFRSALAEHYRKD